MMHTRIKLYGTLRRLSRPKTPGFWEGEIPDGTTIRQMLRLLGAGEYEANAAVINNEPCELDAVIPADAEVTVVTPMGGG